MENNENNYKKYDVSGAGSIIISDDCTWKCGDANGFSFSVTWGKHGEAGGVIDKDDAVKLANHILETVNNLHTTPDLISK